MPLRLAPQALASHGYWRTTTFLAGLNGSDMAAPRALGNAINRIELNCLGFTGGHFV